MTAQSKFDAINGPQKLLAYSFGVPLEVRLPSRFSSTDPALVLPPGFELRANGEPPPNPIALEKTPTGGLGIRVGCRWRERDVPARDSLARLRKHIQIHVAEHSPERVFLHAGVVEWGGVTILLPGRTYAGKSTLAWALVQAGATYLSDEFALLGGGGQVTAFPTPLTLRDGLRRRVVASASDAEAGKSRRPGLILFTEYRAGSTWNARRLTPGVAALRLFQSAVSARSNPQRALKRVSELAKAVPSFACRRSDTHVAVEWLRLARFSLS